MLINRFIFIFFNCIAISELLHGMSKNGEELCLEKSLPRKSKLQQLLNNAGEMGNQQTISASSQEALHNSCVECVLQKKNLRGYVYDPSFHEKLPSLSPKRSCVLGSKIMSHSSHPHFINNLLTMYHTSRCMSVPSQDEKDSFRDYLSHALTFEQALSLCALDYINFLGYTPDLSAKPHLLACFNSLDCRLQKVLSKQGVVKLPLLYKIKYLFSK